MSKGTNDIGTDDIEKEFEEELKKEKRPEESFLPEETEFEKEYEEEMRGEEPPKKKELDPFAEKFYALSTRKFKSETELDNAVNAILNEIEREHFFKGLLAKTGKGGRLLLKKGVATFKDLPAFQAASAITMLARANLNGTLGTLAKTGLRGMQTGTTIPVLKTLGFEAGGGIEQNREAWQNFTNVCKESFDYLARNLRENADAPLEASKLASEAFSTALKKVESELKAAVSIQKKRKIMIAQPSPKRVINRTVTLALGLICIILAAGLVGAIAYYSPMTTNLQSQITEKDNMISTMNATIISLQNSLNQSSTSSATKDAQIAALNRQIGNLFNYLNLNVSSLLVYNQTLYQNAGANTTLYYDIVQFAGFIVVQVQSSTNTTYVRLAYNSYGVNFDSNMTVGLAGTAAFPVLPGYIDLRLGNTNTDNATVAAMVTATYTY